ncbi:MAG: hypothetical protein EXR76_17045 [Myxococcales bacterium]|nr:hypothetical protein [Myxococcales bacterium]
MLVGTGLFTATVLVLLAGPLSAGRPGLHEIIYLIAACVALEVPSSGFGEILISTERIAASSALQVTLALLQTAAFCLPLVFTGRLEYGFHGLLFYALVRLVAFFLVVRYTTVSASVSRLLWEWTPARRALACTQLTYVLPLALSTTLSLLSRNVDKWLVASFDAAAYGAFAIAAIEVPFISMLAGASSTVLATRIVHAFRIKNVEYARQAFVAGAGRLTIVVVPAAMGLMVVAPEALELVFSKEVAAASLSFSLTSAILLCRVTEHGVVLRAAGDTRSLWWSSVVYLAGTSMLGFLGVHLFGAVGVAFGTLLTVLCMWIYGLIRVRRAFGCEVSECFPWPVCGRVLLASIGAAVVARLVGNLPLLLPEHVALRLGLMVLTHLSLYALALRVFSLRRYVSAMPDDLPNTSFDGPVLTTPEETSPPRA